VDRGDRVLVGGGGRGGLRKPHYKNQEESLGRGSRSKKKKRETANTTPKGGGVPQNDKKWKGWRGRSKKGKTEQRYQVRGIKKVGPVRSMSEGKVINPRNWEKRGVRIHCPSPYGDQG